MPLARFGLLEETWLFRSSFRPLAPRLHDLDGIAAFHELDGPYAIVRTHAQGAVDRERVMRGLHARLGERPLAQLHRPLPSPPPSSGPPPSLPRSLRPSREDWALVAAMRARPWADAESLARAAGLSLKGARERLSRIVAERLVTLEAEPRAEPLARAIVRVSPSSSAAARRALEAVEGVVRFALPETGEATFADALVHGAPSLDRARDVPGVRSVDVHAVRARWRDEALVDRLIARVA